jgi:hypothetical protein
MFSDIQRSWQLFGEKDSHKNLFSPLPTARMSKISEKRLMGERF